MSRYIKEGFSSGMSQDDVLGGPNSCLYSKGIDLTGNSNFAQLAKKPIERIDTGSDLPKGFLEVYNGTTNALGVLAFTDNGVYNYSGGSTVVTSEVFLTANFIIGDYAYFVKDNGTTSAYTLYKELQSNCVGSSWTTGLVTTTSPLVTDNYYDFNGVTVLGDIAYIHFGPKVSRYSPNEADEVVEFDIFGEQIAGITYVGGYFRVYTKKGQLMLWDGNSTTISESISLKTDILQVYQVGNIDYIYTPAGLYYMSGYELLPIIRINKSEQYGFYRGTYETNLLLNNMTSFGKSLYGVDRDGGNNNTIFRLGKDVDGLPNAFSLISDKSSYEIAYASVYAVYVSENYLYIGYNDGTNKGVDRIEASNFSGHRVNAGEIITNVNPLGAGLYKKTAKYLYFKVGDVDTDRTITISISIDGGSYTQIGVINEQPLDNIARLPIQGDLRDFSLKFEFSMGTLTNNSTSPKIYYGYAFDYEEHDI